MTQLPLKSVAELFDIPEENVRVVTSLKLDTSPIRGVTGGLVGKKFVVSLPDGKVIVLVKEGILEKAKPEMKEIVDRARKLDGKVIVDLHSGDILFEQNGISGKVNDNGFVIRSPIEKIDYVQSILQKVASTREDNYYGNAKEVIRAIILLKQYLPGSIVVFDDESATLITKSGVAVKVVLDEEANWKKVASVMLATLIKKGVLSEDDAKKIPDQEIRKLVKGMLEKSILDEILAF